MLGAAPRRVWREVDLPIATRAFVVAAGFCARGLARRVRRDAVHRPARLADGADRDLSASSARPGQINFDQALAMSVILMVLTAVVVLAIERVRVRDLGEF